MFEVGQEVIVVHDNGIEEVGTIAYIFAQVAFVVIDGTTILTPLSSLKEPEVEDR